MTADDAEAALAKEDELVEQEQALQNALVVSERVSQILPAAAVHSFATGCHTCRLWKSRSAQFAANSPVPPDPAVCGLLARGVAATRTQETRRWSGGGGNGSTAHTLAVGSLCTMCGALTSGGLGLRGAGGVSRSAAQRCRCVSE